MNNQKEITALKVYQWLDEWDNVIFDDKERRRKPDKFIYFFSLSARELKALSDIQRRTTKAGLARSDDTGVQRRHEGSRSKKIAEFIRYGYPWSDLNETKRESGKFNDLRKPGWLPTAIVLNILTSTDVRNGKKVSKKDLIEIREVDQNQSIVTLPLNFNLDTWDPEELFPIEIIDGQHRLWAFEDKDISDEYQFPVVAYNGLDISWQAYLFWTINVTPKRINASFAYDLYPLLRAETWLEKFDGHSVYRETRAQELTEALWSYSESPWYQRINMLGETGLSERMVSQAAWIRSLMSSYIKSWDAGRIGGLYGTPLNSNKQILPWGRAQQAAFLIKMGQFFQESIRESKALWAEALRFVPQSSLFDFDDDIDRAFTSPYNLINTDQGIRGLLYVTNDIFFISAKELELEFWDDVSLIEETDSASGITIETSLRALQKQPFINFLKNVTDRLASFDWRSSSAPGLSQQDQMTKSALRGSGGYKVFRMLLLRHLSDGGGNVGKVAENVLNILGY